MACPLKTQQQLSANSKIFDEDMLRTKRQLDNGFITQEEYDTLRKGFSEALISANDAARRGTTHSYPPPSNNCDDSDPSSSDDYDYDDDDDPFGSDDSDPPSSDESSGGDDDSTALKITEATPKPLAVLGEKRLREVAAPESKIYELHIALNDTKVWRKFQVLSNTPFDELHRVIQIVMGWDDMHLHVFQVDGEDDTLEIGDVTDGYCENTALDEREYELGKHLLKEGDSFGYSYDFGDGWDHSVTLEKILDPEQGAVYPRCVAGKYACPPEDCGGVGGYFDLVSVLAKPNHKRYKERREWVGDDYDPKHFHVEEVNHLLTAWGKFE